MNTHETHQALTFITHEAAAPRHAFRSLAAVIGGLVSTFAITTAADLALHALRIFPPFGQRMPDSLFALALAYRVVFNTVGANLTARWAPSHPKQHALALGVIGVVLATIGAVVMGKYGPAWYSLANILVAMPCAWFGGRLYHPRAPNRAAFMSN